MMLMAGQMAGWMDAWLRAERVADRRHGWCWLLVAQRVAASCLVLSCLVLSLFTQNHPPARSILCHMLCLQVIPNRPIPSLIV
jgi:hypothetical protein